VGDWSRMRFWHDVWWEDQTLKEAFPMFSIARHKEALVADHVQLSNDSLQWDVPFIKAATNCEVELVTSFFNLSYSLKLS
jgi:hypothetical protein